MSRDYEDIADRNISEIKDLVEEEDLDSQRLLEAEKDNKDRKTLKEWLNRRIDRSGSEETTMTEQSNDGAFTFSLTAKQIALATFLIGFFLGGFFMSTLNQVSPTGEVTGTQGETADQAPDNNGDSPSDTGQQPSEDSVDMSQISLDGEPVLGNGDAAVTMVIFEDFECPFCKRFEENAMPQIKSNFVDSGQVKVVWKDLPLPERIHPWADEGAAAMECVFREGGNDVFWAVKDKVFANQDSINQNNAYSQIKQFASEEGVDASAVQSCLDNDNPMEEVNQDKQEAGSVGATGTPTAFIAGQKIVGAQPYPRFESAITSALEG